MNSVLVLGGTGMLGQMMVRVLSQTETLAVRFTCRRQETDPFFFDIEDGLHRLEEIFKHHGPFSYLINCIGVLRTEIDEEDSGSLRRAVMVNALFPHDLGILANNAGTRVIHVSTDGVFSVNAGICLEDTPCDCDDTYGKSKSLGEVIAPRFLNVRCSLIGPDPIKKKGVLEWYLAQSDGREVEGYIDHFWNGVTTLQFAELCKRIIIQDSFDEIWSESPVHHFCPNRPVSKYQLLEMFRASFKKDINIKRSLSPKSPVRRILASRYNSLERIFGVGHDLGEAVAQLAGMRLAIR